MRTLLRRLITLLGHFSERVLGLLGGLVCAAAVSLIALYSLGIFRYHFLIFALVTVTLFVVGSVAGWLSPRYFSCFFMPVFNLLANDEGTDHCDDGYSWKAWVAMAGWVFGLIFLLVGALFQIHIIFGFGLLLFVAFATTAPTIFLADDKRR
ncbi:MAG: hypothetical protein AAB370_04290 [Verrucomicrobiota bacterium]